MIIASVHTLSVKFSHYLYDNYLLNRYSGFHFIRQIRAGKRDLDYPKLPDVYNGVLLRATVACIVNDVYTIVVLPPAARKRELTNRYVNCVVEMSVNM